jgi:hypothetical protein
VPFTGHPATSRLPLEDSSRISTGKPIAPPRLECDGEQSCGHGKPAGAGNGTNEAPLRRSFGHRRGCKQTSVFRVADCQLAAPTRDSMAHASDLMGKPARRSFCIGALSVVLDPESVHSPITSADLRPKSGSSDARYPSSQCGSIPC